MPSHSPSCGRTMNGLEPSSAATTRWPMRISSMPYTAGAVFGIELIRMGHLVVAADDGSSPFIVLPQDGEWDGMARTPVPNGERNYAAAAAAQLAQRHGDVSL